MRTIRLVLVVTIACATSLVVAAPAEAKAKPADPTPWQTALCARMRDFLISDGTAFEALRATDPSASQDDRRLAVARTLQDISTAAGALLHLDRLGSLPGPKAKSIERDLQRELDRARKRFVAAEAKGRRLTTPVEPRGPALRAIDTDLTTGAQIFGDALHHVYGHTGDHRFDRAILANDTCSFIRELPSATSTA